MDELTLTRIIQIGSQIGKIPDGLFGKFLNKTSTIMFCLIPKANPAGVDSI